MEKRIMNFNKKLTNEGNKKNVPVKRLIQAGAVTLAFTAMLGTAVINSNASSEDVNTGSTAGVIAALNGADLELQVSDANVTSVGLDSESASWILSLMANVENYTEVKAAPDENAAVVGKLRRGDMARVESLTDNGWYQITSGNVTGYVNSSMCVTGQACKDLATAVGYNGSVAISLEEEAAQIAAAQAAAEEAAKKAAAEEAAKKAAASKSTSVTMKESYSASVDEVTLLAAIIEKEDGSDGYEGQLAVASAIMNRVRSSKYPNTIEGVIDQKGQFTGGIAGLSKILSRGPSSTSRRAAEAALAGADTVDGMTNFRAVWTGHSGTQIGEHVFF